MLDQYQEQTVNIAVVYNNYPSVYRTIYLNGVFFKSVSMNSTLFANLDTAYLGRARALGVGPGLNANFQEYRIYFGELSSENAQSIFLVGTDPSHITLSSESTMSNVNLTFYSTSVVSVDVQFFGGSPGPGNGLVGSSFLFDMFGSETSFQFVPVDPQCTYQPQFSLNSGTSTTGANKIPAMNYSVVLADCPLPAPQFSSSSCPTPGTPCICSASMSPMQYMTASQSLNQSLSITDVNETVSVLQFYYHTGVCYEVVGSEYFASNYGTNVNGQSCFDTNVFYMNKTSGSIMKTKNVVINLFERYPEGTSWFSLQGNAYVTNSVSDGLFNWYIPNSAVTIQDLVSNVNIQNAAYNTSLVNSCAACHTAKPVGFPYTINATNVFPTFPFDLSFLVYVVRNGPDGPVAADNTWYIPVVGVTVNSVPNIYPVSSDPNLIFLIIRDPPGSDSKVSIKSGTTFTFGLSIDGMQTFDTSLISNQLSATGKKVEKGFGWFKDSDAVDTQLITGTNSDQILKIANSYGSSSQYDYSFTFQSDFSTSLNPNIAGHPSDVIIGGGVDIAVVEATQGKNL